MPPSVLPPSDLDHGRLSAPSQLRKPLPSCTAQTLPDPAPHSRTLFELHVLCAVARTDLVLRLGFSGTDARPGDTCCTIAHPNPWPLCPRCRIKAISCHRPRRTCTPHAASSLHQPTWCEYASSPHVAGSPSTLVILLLASRSSIVQCRTAIAPWPAWCAPSSRTRVSRGSHQRGGGGTRGGFPSIACSFPVGADVDVDRRDRSVFVSFLILHPFPPPTISPSPGLSASSLSVSPPYPVAPCPSFLFCISTDVLSRLLDVVAL